MKKILYPICALFSLTLGLQAVVNPGDIAFTLYDANGGDDQFAFVALNPIAGGEEIFFRDDEWDGTAFGNGEDELLWTAPAEGLAAGSIVVFNSSVITVNVGTVTQELGNPGFGLTSGGDDIWAFTGSSNTPTTFLAVISATTSFNNLAIDPADGTLLGTGLTPGTAFAIQLINGVDEAQYTGLRTSLPTIPDYATLIQDVAANWTQTEPSDGSQIPADTTAFITGGNFLILDLVVSIDTFSENAGPAASLGTVSLTTAQSTDLDITLLSSDITEATVPSTVTITAGTLAANFNIDAIDDLQDDGDRTVTISAALSGAEGAEADLLVTDDADNPTTVLEAGDILFTCFNTDSNSFGFAAISDIPAGEIIFFTDAAWDDSIDAFEDNEADITWTSPTGGISAGEIISISGTNDNAGPFITDGDGSITGGGSGINGATETIYAYQGPAARVPVTFLAAITNHTGDSIVNTGLTAGVDAFFLDESADYGDYDAARFGQASIADYAPLIADLAANWIMVVDGDNATEVCNDTNFIIGGGPATITIVDCGFDGDNFFIEVAEGTTSLSVTSSDTLDFANSTPVNANIDPNNPNRFLIPEAERNLISDFFRVEL